MRPAEYQSLDAMALAELIGKGEVTPVEVMACAVSLACDRNPALNALTYERYDESIDLAKQWRPAGTFQGIPFLLKDTGVASRRFPSSLGSGLFNDVTYQHDATVVERFERAGLIAFARTTVPELCMGPCTDASRNGGATRNPHDTTRSAGGSSGGAAAAVAAGLVPIAHGGDGGGSIRIPSACCGVFGLKPSRGRIPAGPPRGEGWGGLATDGVISRTVRDTAAAMDAVSGYEPGAPYAAPPQTESYLEAVSDKKRKPLRIAVWRRAWDDIPIASECIAAVDHAARLCADLGHEIIDGAPPALDYQAFVRANANMLATNVVLALDARLQVLGRALKDDDLEEFARDGYEVGKGLRAADYAAAINHFHLIGRIFQSAMQDIDLVLTPTLTRLPAPLGEFAMNRGFWDFRIRSSRYGTFLAPVNASGLPAANVPLHWTEAGIPVGTHIIGHFGREDVVLRLAAELERAAPWAHRIAQP